jgi:hypothetical protein
MPTLVPGMFCLKGVTWLRERSHGARYTEGKRGLSDAMAEFDEYQRVHRRCGFAVASSAGTGGSLGKLGVAPAAGVGRTGGKYRPGATAGVGGAVAPEYSAQGATGMMVLRGRHG